MSDNEQAFPGMGTPPSSPIPPPNPAGPPGLGTPPSSPVAQSANPPAAPAGQQPVATGALSAPNIQGPVVQSANHAAPAGQQPVATGALSAPNIQGPVVQSANHAAPAGQQPVATGALSAANIQAPVAPVALTDRQAGESMSIPLPVTQLPVRPVLGPAHHHDELNTPSPLTLASDLPSMSQNSENSASIHTQSMAGTHVASGQGAAPAQRIWRLGELAPLVWVPPPTSPPPGLSTETSHDQGQQRTVRAIIPGLMTTQGCPPGTVTFASTQPPDGAGSAHVTAFGAPFVTHGPPGLEYVQPPAAPSVPRWQMSDNNPVGGFASAGMPNGHQYPPPPGLQVHTSSIGGFASAGMPNGHQYPPPPGLQVHATAVGGFASAGMPNGHQYPPPPGLQVHATAVGGFPIDGARQPAVRQFSVTPPWRRDNAGRLPSGGIQEPHAQQYPAPPNETITTVGTQQPAVRQFSVTPPWRRDNAGRFPSGGIQQPHAQQYSARPQQLNTSSTGGLPATSSPQPAARQFSVTPPWRRRQVMPARQQINDDNLQHPRPVRPALRLAGALTPQNSERASLKRTYRPKPNSRADKDKDAGQGSAGPSTGPRPKRARRAAPRSDATVVARAPLLPASIPATNANTASQEQNAAAAEEPTVNTDGSCVEEM
ncbi:hypothetical protein EN45_074510 [Penicillium chrysogenum]|uniref:Uncharacterized protein n=2 Tax=Penicillium chrysogenum species complex TaxID=254878 RepID=B6HKV7_PENRW|nr:uncharacterized protein N7525_007761 [Penicillium rubens]KZN88861.1 hypothetical protein EN45_074510 [Penicillium chrysogenum]CAP96083.1 hypothetical protein PCH_Pc21g11860 [Penicillium rubens Wisconsin 54-1255]KAJ5049025.1 hypothetical protein NUH16_007537 [Penicillium rubens]KAJ5829508.1 hypothetical protein N7525_007761 [Penicillium rubens]KAJ5852846.1 hypothetical protein N7534_005389 [Penicillium rubens]